MKSNASLFKQSLLTVAIMTVASGAMAAGQLATVNQSATLKVQGKVTPAACDVSFNNGGVVNFGTNLLANLNQDTATQLTSQVVAMTIDCGAQIRTVGFSTKDEKSDSVAVSVTVEKSWGENGSTTPQELSNVGFGLGNTKGGEPLGAYTISVVDPKAVTYTKGDTTAADGKLLEGSAAGWSASVRGLMSNGQQVSASKGGVYTVAAANGNVPAGLTKATFNLKVAAALQPTKKLDITDETNIDGQATINLVYL